MKNFLIKFFLNKIGGSKNTKRRVLNICLKIRENILILRGFSSTRLKSYNLLFIRKFFSEYV